MKILILQGSMENRPHSSEMVIVNHLVESIKAKGFTPVLFELSTANIPLFDPTSPTVPDAVVSMCQTLKEADYHIWFTPLYHGSMTGALKNALDWVEITRTYPTPYLTGKIVALTCLSDGLHALQGINAMDAVAKSLRAWVLPFSLPIMKQHLYEKGSLAITDFYRNKFDQLISMLAEAGVHSPAKIQL